MGIYGELFWVPKLSAYPKVEWTKQLITDLRWLIKSSSSPSIIETLVSTESSREIIGLNDLNVRYEDGLLWSSNSPGWDMEPRISLLSTAFAHCLISLYPCTTVLATVHISMTLRFYPFPLRSWIPFFVFSGLIEPLPYSIFHLFLLSLHFTTHF